MLNVFQLMMALSLDWLTMTELDPGLTTVAVPPTTVGPSGPADDGSDPSATRTALISRIVRKRMGIAAFPLVFGRGDKEEPPVVARPLHRLGGRQINVEDVAHTKAEPCSSRRGALARRCPGDRGDIMKPAVVIIAIKLGLSQRRDLMGDIEPHLAERNQAAVSQEFRGIIGSAEHTPAVPAQLRGEQRVDGVLAVSRGQDREIRKQRLQPSGRGLDLGKVDAAVGARGKVLPVVGRAKAVDALA